MKTARMSAFTSVIVTYNSRGEVGDLLGDLARHASGSPVVVVDNASQDGSAALVAGQFPHVHLLRNRQNVGYSRAANQGAAMCATPYILLLNPDIRIPDATVLTELLACMDSQPDVAAAAPLQFQEDEQGRRLTFTWSYLSWEAFRFYWQQRFHRLPPKRAPMPVPFLNAGCLMLRRAAFEQVGRLNEKYFLYGEEPDLALKLRRYGYGCRLLPEASIVHYRERSISRVALRRRIFYRVMAFCNVLDALINGVGGLCVDALTRLLLPKGRSEADAGRN